MGRTEGTSWPERVSSGPNAARGAGETTLTSRHRVGAQPTRGASPTHGNPRAPPHSREQVRPFPRGGRLGACAVWGKVTRGGAPPPFVPWVGGGAKASRAPSPGAPGRGADAATRRCRGRPGRAPCSPTRTRNPARERSAAAAPMPGAGERLQSVAGSGGKRPPTGGRAGRRVPRGAGALSRSAGPRAAA